ncbi:MAG: hypothetical protein A4S14_04445 [Proteobacteria bacterium SG_bin9]|nr:MAG: hypothetical protein A4S14_04445 [Proteobacteria bacterium SG_bin9]
MKKLIGWSVVAAGLLVSVTAQAEVWPSKIVKAVIPFGAGSATDVVPRMVFEKVAIELGQPITVENRAGAGGTLGSTSVARAEPDGYTILAHSAAHTIAPSIFPDMKYDPAKDFSSALMIGSSGNVMITSPMKPWKTIQEFVAAAKAKDAQITFGTVGPGSAVHVSAEKFRLAAGFEATHIPYRGGPEVIADILGGRIDFYFCPLSTALPLIKSGQVRALVISSATRWPDLPDVPTPTEAGFKDGETSNWFGIFMPAKTPRDIVEKFNAAGRKVLATPEMQASLARLGVELTSMTPGQMDEFVVREMAANAALVKAANIKQ